MINDLRKLFDGQAPSVKRFNEALAGMSATEKSYYYQHAYDIAMHAWKITPVVYRQFRQNLVQHNWQRFLDYLHEDTILGSLTYPLRDPGMTTKMFRLLELSTREQRVSFNHLAFALLLVFNFHLKVSTLGDYIRTATFYPEELLDLLGAATVLP